MLINKRMKTITAFIASIALAGTFFILPGYAVTAESTEEAAVMQDIRMTMQTESYDSNTVIVVMKPEASGLHVQYGLNDFKGIGNITEVNNLTYIPEGEKPELASEDYRTILSLSLENGDEESILATMEALLEMKEVEKAYLNVALKTSAAIVAPVNDPLYETQSVLETIKADEAWAIDSGSASVKVGVIDTGVDYKHEDLSGNIWISPGETPGDKIDNDNNGFIDDVNGWNFYDKNNDVSDMHWHGTAVASIFGAVTNNNIGIAGVSPNVSIVPLRTGFVDEKDGQVSLYAESVVQAIQYSIKNKVDIINLSAESTEAIQDAIKNYTGLFVTAAGNDGSNNDVKPTYPVAAGFDNVIKVASTTKNDTLAEGSNYGAKDVAIAAPGENISVAVPMGTIISGTAVNYAEATGTSFAASFVTGAAALIKSYRPDLSAAQIIEALTNSADKVEALKGKVASGRLNVKAALEYAAGVKINKSVLGNLIESAERLIEADYTKESWAAFVSAVEEAKAILAKDTATQPEVNDAAAKLKDAINGLVLAGKSSETPSDNTSSTSDTARKKSNNPKTGDPAPFIIFFTVLGVSAGCTILLKKKRPE